MKPDEKYMSETSSKEENKRFNFIPPSFNRSLLINDSTDDDSNNFLDLFPSETNKSELFCYYSSFSDCDDKNLKAINKFNSSGNKGYSNNNNPNYNNGSSGYSNNNNPNYNNSNSGYSNNNPNYNNNNNGYSNNNPNYNNNNNGYSNNNNPNYNNQKGYSNNNPNNNYGNNPNYNSQNRNPSTFDILRDFDLDLDETTDFERNEDTNSVDRIFSKIQTKHSGILDTLTTYNIPSPISNIIVKRLIKLSLLYSEEK